VIVPVMGIGPLGAGEWTVGGLGTGTPAAATTTPGTAASAATTSSGSFGDALTSAIGSLEATQANATVASQQLATGKATDPTQAITAVENATLSMDFAAQIRNQVDSAATTLFQTQV
jgi:flagellar hook-basal body complex protein FliE